MAKNVLKVNILKVNTCCYQECLIITFTVSIMEILCWNRRYYFVFQFKKSNCYIKAACALVHNNINNHSPKLK